MNAAPVPGVYRHFKGKDYRVLGVAKHTESDEPLVLYLALYPVHDAGAIYGETPTFARPLASFQDVVEVDGERISRFRLIERD
ncbi:DUF1653 domain-containing protein [Naasia lichenicola]|uniref:DUF1653 domain-containing protein n=2 Tax=Naasia lichenicola TaxID=2565933 RepID=A0A4S4FGH2_9MICO|nr:DUF1653 domain-containing protein [Naasia lichenicola]